MGELPILAPARDSLNTKTPDCISPKQHRLTGGQPR